MDFSTLKQKIANLFSFDTTAAAAAAAAAATAATAAGASSTALEPARRATRSTPLSLFRSGNDNAVRIGTLQRSGSLAVAPLFGPDRGARFLPPLSGLKLSRVAGYGNVEIECRSGIDGGVAILPLHIGYIQDKAQNHALCRSALMGSGQKRMFDDACCVQSGQGGFLEGRDQWFFVLPVELRETALNVRGTKDFKKLWSPISKLNVALGLPERGHLEQIICHDRYYLTQYSSRFELLPGQTGALFFANDELIGVEVAPNAEYFAEAWMPLVCFSYGVLAKKREDLARKNGTDVTTPGGKPTTLKGLNKARELEGSSLSELRSSLITRRRDAATKTLSAIGRSLNGAIGGTSSNSSSSSSSNSNSSANSNSANANGAPTITEEERFLDLRLSTIDAPLFKGQVVEEEDRLIYLSLFASSKHLDAIA